MLQLMRIYSRMHLEWIYSICTALLGGGLGRRRHVALCATLIERGNATRLGIMLMFLFLK